MLLLQDIFQFSIVALGVYLADHFGRFLPVSSLSSAFFSAAIVCKMIEGIEPNLLFVFATIGIVSIFSGFVSSVLSCAFHEGMMMDRLSSSVIVYFVLLGLAFYFSDNGVVKSPLPISSPLELRVLYLFMLFVLAVVVLLLFERSFVGLKSRAFSANPQFSRRFGFSEKATYLPALMIGEAIICFAANMYLLDHGQVEYSFSFKPILIAIAVAGFMGVIEERRKYSSLSVLIMIVLLVSFWRFGYQLGYDFQVSYNSLSDIKYDFANLFMGVCIALTGVLIKLFKRINNAFLLSNVRNS